MESESGVTNLMHVVGPREGKGVISEGAGSGLYVVNKGLNSMLAVLGKSAIWETPGPPFCLPFGSICPPFGSRRRIFGPSGPPWAAFWTHLRARGGAGAFFVDFGCPGGGPKVSRRQGRCPSGAQGKQHFALRAVFLCGFRHIRRICRHCRLCKASDFVTSLCLFSTATGSRVRTDAVQR